MITKVPALENKMIVTFSMPASFWADTIHLVGDFNNWDPAATEMQLDDTCWNVTLELDAGRAYQYRFLVNRTDWVTDWQSDRFATDEHGNENSVVVTLLANELPDEHTPVRQRQRPALRVIAGGRAADERSEEKQAV